MGKMIKVEYAETIEDASEIAEKALRNGADTVRTTREKNVYKVEHNADKTDED